MFASTALKNSKFLGWTKPYKIAQLFKNIMVMSSPSIFSLTLKANTILIVNFNC